AETVAVSAGSITTLIPTAASSAWMNCETRSAMVSFCVSRCTVGFGMPDAAMSFFASFGSYGVHLMLGSNIGLAGEIGVQSAWLMLSERTLTIVLRSIASSNACRSFALDASGVPGLEGGVPTPFLLAMLMMIPR